MRKIIRLLFLLTPLIIVGFAVYEHEQWHPPLNPNIPQVVSIKTLLEHNESYQAPMQLITYGEVFNKSVSGDIIFLKYLNGLLLRVNCTAVNVSDVEVGMILYLKGYSYIHEADKNYFLAEEIHILISYSMILSIPGAVLILIILFLGFRFNFKDFSFSRKVEEER